MAQQLRVFAALPENLGTIPKTHMVAYDHLELQLQRIQRFWVPPAPTLMCTYPHADTHNHI